MYLHRSVVFWMLLHLVLSDRYAPHAHESGFNLPSIFESFSDAHTQVIKQHRKHQIVAKQVILKEDSANTNNATCSNIGHLVYDYQQKDVCSGYFCIAKEALCEGSTIEIAEGYQTLYNISTQCTITTISCNNDSQIYDMSSQFGAQNCIVEKVKCGSEEIFAPNINNTLLQTCDVQIVCDEKTRYGYEYFGFSCEQQQLSCTFVNGSTILLPANLTQVDQNEIQNCSVLMSGCLQENLNGTTPCLDYNVECEGDSINECELHVERLSCSSDPSCKVSLFMCNGTVLNATDVNGSLDGCSVVELNCENGTQQLYPNTDFNAENCTISQMICNGIVVNDPQAYSGQLFQDFCNVTRLKCIDNTSLCTIHKLACTSEPNCSISVSEFSCVNPASCLQQVNETRCACPIDYMGEECEKPRSLACNFFWINNGSVCQSVMKQTPQSDPSCTMSSQNQDVSLCFDLDCEFSPTPTTSEQVDAAGQNFTYFLQSDKFNLSLPTYWNMKLKIFNFNMLSDSNELHNVSLDKTQMQGQQHVCWNLSLGNVSEQYWFGDRLYIEIAWNGISPSGISSGQNLERLFIDSPYDQGVPNSSSYGGSSNTALIVGIVFGVLGFGVIVLVWKNRHYVFTKLTKWVTKKD